jgi:hypothetical protein
MAFAETENNLDLDVSAEAGYIDNFLYQASNEQNTAFYKLSSKLALASKSQQSVFNLDAKLDSFLFDNFKDDEHTDFSVMPKYQFKFAQNQRFYVSAHWRNSYMYRGTGISLGNANSLTEGDERENVGALLGFEYGNIDSQGRLNVEMSYNEGEFNTRRVETSELDSEIFNLNSSFDYLLSGKTYMAFDVDYRVIDYPNDASRNRDSITGLVGVKWQTTVISELSLLVGYQNLKFEDTTLVNDDTFKWRFDYTWRPSDFTTVHAMSNRRFDENYRLINSYRLAELYQIDVEHAFTDAINISVAFALNNEQFIAPESKREEDYFSSTLALNYQRSKRLSFHLNYQYRSLDTDYADRDYLYNSVSLALNVKL